MKVIPGKLLIVIKPTLHILPFIKLILCLLYSMRDIYLLVIINQYANLIVSKVAKMNQV